MSQLAVLILFSSLISGHYGSLAAHNRLRTSVGQPIPANITVSWYKQKVDHFSVANNDYFQQKVITSTDHWGGEGSPIFIYAGNEGGIFEFANNTGFMWERAAEFKAMVVFVEHRYYGESMPYGNDSYKSLDKLGYLSSEQALADYATFIQDLKLTTKGAARSPVIVFGGSYGGMLASWFRIKYPHLAIGALAASAPIWQFPGIYDCEGYFKVVSNDFEQYSQECAQSINASWAAIGRVASSEEGRQWLHDTFQICEPLSDQAAVDNFVDFISSAYGSLAMTDYPNAATFLQPLPAYPMKETCKKLTKPDQPDRALLRDIYGAISVFYNYTGSVECNSIQPDAITTGWDFQTCTEMVMPVCSNSRDDIFPLDAWNFTQFSDTCYKTWKTKPDPLKILTMYGGKDLKAASNIIFSNGDRDPWSVGGVQVQVGSPSVHIITVPHGCHHEDLRPTGPNDPPELRAVREKEAGIIRGWIEEYYKSEGFLPDSWKNVKFV